MHRFLKLSTKSNKNKLKYFKNNKLQNYDSNNNKKKALGKNVSLLTPEIFVQLSHFKINCFTVNL